MPVNSLKNSPGTCDTHDIKLEVVKCWPKEYRMEKEGWTYYYCPKCFPSSRGK